MTIIPWIEGGSGSRAWMQYRVEPLGIELHAFGDGTWYIDNPGGGILERGCAEDKSLDTAQKECGRALLQRLSVATQLLVETGLRFVPALERRPSELELQAKVQEEE